MSFGVKGNGQSKEFIMSLAIWLFYYKYQDSKKYSIKKTCAYQNIINDMRCRFIFHRRQKENNSFSVKRVTKRAKNNVKKVKKKIIQKY